MLTSAHRGALPQNHPLLKGQGLRVAIVQSRFHEELTQAMAQHCQAQLKVLGVRTDDMVLVTVPGALEIPVALQALAEQDSWDALIAIGCVIRGETFHFELVAQTCTQALSRLALDYQIPILNAVLTTENLAQAQDRSLSKSQEAACGAVEMVNCLSQLS
jgi:6,7-dimethyl-8-ribityllumazine synthase